MQEDKDKAVDDPKPVIECLSAAQSVDACTQNVKALATQLECLQMVKINTESELHANVNELTEKVDELEAIN